MPVWCSARDWVSSRNLHVPSLREVIDWPDSEPWPLWAAAAWPQDCISTINTQQFPDKAYMNACCDAVLQTDPTCAELPQVGCAGASATVCIGERKETLIAGCYVSGQ